MCQGAGRHALLLKMKAKMPVTQQQISCQKVYQIKHCYKSCKLHCTNQQWVINQQGLASQLDYATQNNSEGRSDDIGWYFDKRQIPREYKYFENYLFNINFLQLIVTTYKTWWTAVAADA